jgi:hypothetical protein
MTKTNTVSPPSISAVRPSRSTERRRSPGRYEARGLARVVGAAPLTATQNVRTAIGAVQNPLDPSERILARINRLTDILELERSKRRISEADYQVGRQIQLAFEKVTRVGGTNWSGADRVDAAVAHELSIIHGLEQAADIRDLMTDLSAVVGSHGATYLRAILVDSQSFAAFAGKGASELAIRSVAEHFRKLLRAVSDHRAAKGRQRGEIKGWQDFTTSEAPPAPANGNGDLSAEAV